MRYTWLWILLAASTALSQECTVYMIVDPFDKVTHLGIDGLKADDFEAKLGNAALPIVSSTQSFSSRVLVLVQAAGSAEDPHILELARRVAEMARQAPADRPLAFGAFGNHTSFTKGFSRNLQERNAGIDEVMSRLSSLGKDAAVFDALHEAIALFGQEQPGDTIVLVSSEHDIRSKRNDRDLEKELSQHHVRLLATVFIREVAEIQTLTSRIQNIDRKHEEIFTLHRLATVTGGAYTRGLNPDMIDFAWAGYLLGVRAPAGLDKPKSWKLQLRGDAAKTHKDALIYQPYSLVPCAGTTTAGN